MTTQVTSIRVTQNQGDTLDTFKCVTTDLTSSYTIAPEDDIVWINDRDPNGFPTVNLLLWPDFGGTFTSGVAQGWAYTNANVAGATPSKYTGGCPAGTSQGQALSITNVASGTTFTLLQNVSLPTDENNAPILAPGYCPSIYVLTPTLMSGVSQLTLKVNWMDASTNVLRTDSFSMNFPTVATGWVRMSIGAGASGIVVSNPIAPPANTVLAGFQVVFSTTSATNSGQVVFAAAQLEMCTFRNYRTNNFLNPANYFNSKMTSATTTTPVVVDQAYLYASPAGSTFSLVTTPTLYGKAQQIAITNVPISSTPVSIAQNFMHHADYTYTLTATYQVTTALSGNASVQLGVSLANNSATVGTATNLTVSSAWQVLQLTYGPGAASNNTFTSPTGSAATVYFGILNNSSATNAGAVVLASLTISAVPSTRPGAYTKAINFGQYPTAYCGPGSSGLYYEAYTDSSKNVWYRQQRYYGGFIRNVVYDYSKSAERSIEIDAVDYSILLNEAPATLLIQKQPDNLAIKQACDYASNLGFLEGLDYTTYVQNIITVDAMLFNWVTTRDVISKIADHSVAAFWVDPYKRLHYQQALATTAPFGISDNPDMRTTYPAEALKIQNDSTDTLTSPVIEGSTQLSAPQTLTFNGYNTTLSAGFSQGANLTALSVNPIAFSIVSGTYLTISSGATIMSATVSANVAASATSIPITAETAPYTISLGDTVAVTGYQLNSSFPIAQIDSVTLGGTAQTVGIINVNAYSQGYGALVDLQAGMLYFQPAPANGTGNVVVAYRYAAPVIVRLHAPLVESSTGKVRRKIHQHITETTISSQQTAINRANAELTVSSKPKAVGSITLRSPYAPFDNTLSVGQALPVTFSKAGITGNLYQIQQIDTTPLGNNSFTRTLKLGYYRPDFIIYMAQAKRQQNFSDAYTSGTVLQDVLSSQDAWAMGDTFTYSVSNIGKWGSNAGAGNWGAGTNVLVWG